MSTPHAAGLRRLLMAGAVCLWPLSVGSESTITAEDLQPKSPAISLANSLARPDYPSAQPVSPPSKPAPKVKDIPAKEVNRHGWEPIRESPVEDDDVLLARPLTKHTSCALMLFDWSDDSPAKPQTSETVLEQEDLAVVGVVRFRF